MGLVAGVWHMTSAYLSGCFLVRAKCLHNLLNCASQCTKLRCYNLLDLKASKASVGAICSATLESEEARQRLATVSWIGHGQCMAA